MLVSIEGISGVGKTWFVRKLQALMPNALFVSEVTERRKKDLGLKIIDVLNSSNDAFFRMGVPRSETFLLLALKIWDYENHIASALDSGQVCIEDRSIDTVAVYQAIMLAGHNLEARLRQASKIYAVAAQWRKMPDVTFLIEDDFKKAVSRAEARSERQYSEDEIAILQSAAELYAAIAQKHPSRIVRLDRRRMTPTNILRRMIGRIDGR